MGFKLMYYETAISKNKKDIKESIKIAKRENENLNKILFYINREFSEIGMPPEINVNWKVP